MNSLVESSLLRAMELTFNRELPGFIGAHNFVLEPVGDENGSVFAKLVCLDSVALHTGVTLGNLSLLVVTPGILWPDYQLSIDQAIVDRLGIGNEEDVVVMAIVRPNQQLSFSTANLYSPIVANRINGLAEQLIPSITESEAGWSIRTLFPQDEEM